MSKRVLSIQSHVVSGYVGNKAAVFPLQLMGFDVDYINSVHFSNHTGYKHLTGDVLNGQQLRSILDGLDKNDLLQDVGYLLTGYIGSVSFLEAVIDVLQKLRSRHHEGSVYFVCDPVLGDHGEFYAPKELVQVYKERLLPLADVITPNQFEVEALTGIKIQTMDDAIQACDTLHKIGPTTVFITSLQLPMTGNNSNNNNNVNKTISILASRRKRQQQQEQQQQNNDNDNNNQHEIWRVDCPLLPGRYTGTGDLTAALLLGHTAKNPHNLPLVMENVINTMHVVIKRTLESCSDSVKSRELKLIQSKNDIESPPAIFKAQRL